MLWDHWNHCILSIITVSCLWKTMLSAFLYNLNDDHFAVLHNAGDDCQTDKYYLPAMTQWQYPVWGVTAVITLSQNVH